MLVGGLDKIHQGKTIPQKQEDIRLRRAMGTSSPRRPSTKFVIRAPSSE